MSDFEKNLDKAVENYEKNFDKIANKTANTLEKVERGANKVYIGCATIFGNLFFAAFCLWGVYAAVVAYQLETTGVVTPGIVIGLDESNTNGSSAYSPIVEFTANGQTYTFESGNASSPPAYQVGETVNVRYDPADPNIAQIDKYSERWLMPIILIPSMICGSIILTFFMVRAWRRGQNVLPE